MDYIFEKSAVYYRNSEPRDDSDEKELIDSELEEDLVDDDGDMDYTRGNGTVLLTLSNVCRQLPGIWRRQSS